MRFAVIIAVCIILLSGVKDLYAFDFIFNPLAGYTNWYQPFSGMDNDDMAPIRYKGDAPLTGWTYGARMTMVFNQHVALSLSYQYGKLSTGYNNDFIDSTSQYKQAFQESAFYHNVYGAFVFPVTSYFKLFAGLRYEPVIMKIRQQGGVCDLGGGNSRYAVYKVRLESLTYRPLLGFGLSIPFARYFGFTLNVSGQYIIGNLDCKGSMKEYDAADLDSLVAENELFDYGLTVFGWGGEVEPALVGFINDSVWVVAGFQYQYSTMTAEGTIANRDVFYSNLQEHRFGVLLSVVFRF